MNSLDFDAPQLRIISYLATNGATTSERLAAQLAAPHGNVRFALEQLHERQEPVVTRLPFGLWDCDQTAAAA